MTMAPLMAPPLMSRAREASLLLPTSMGPSMAEAPSTVTLLEA